jgi:hypothetical protein
MNVAMATVATSSGFGEGPRMTPLGAAAARLLC